MIAGSASTYGIGWTTKQVKIREIDPTRRIARCVDTEGQVLDVALAIHRTGIRPQVGQVWLADRELSAWTLRAFVEFGEQTAVPAVSTSWAPLTLTNGWGPSHSEDDPPPSARVTAEGWVELSGVMYSGTVPPVGQTLAVAQLPTALPPCYRANVVLGSHLPAGAGYVRGHLLPEGVVAINISAAYTPNWIDLTNLRARVRDDA
ncbi:hypothetical protein [Streptomyces albidoflavus]|uniref:hypothetical protein n=1 Tax=Streptomyces albidoflavus TaxID=1886 RepID=UPI0033DC84B6